MPLRDDGILPVTFEASEAIVQYRWVALDTATPEHVEIATAWGTIMWVTQRDADVVGEHVAVKCDGFTLITAWAAFAIGTELKVWTAGKFIAAASTDTVVAIATQASTADLDVVEARIVTPYEKA